MFDILQNTPTSTEVVDIIEKRVYEFLKPRGFRKHGRTLHRFVSGDISQVINFQIGLAARGRNDVMWVNTGIRVPECAERSLDAAVSKKYYHEYECNIRSRLGTVSGKAETTFSLKEPPERLAKSIIEEITESVLPAFEVLHDRESILKYRADYPQMDMTDAAALALDQTMLYLKLGDLDRAKEIFWDYYEKSVREYEYTKEHGAPSWVQEVHQILASVQADECVLFYANDGNIRYLDELAARLNLK